MLARIISISFLSFIIITCFLLFPVALVIFVLTYPFDRQRRVLHYFTCFWGSIYVWVMPAWSLTVTGKEKIPAGQACIVVSNHQSLLDILVAFTLFFPFKWVSKAEVFDVPLIGWNMVLNDYIKLKRGDKESIIKMMQDAERHLRNGSSVYMFPEGTRSWNGQVKAFKTGAFRLARKLKLPILPIVINGTTDALPKHSLKFHGHHDITVSVLDPIPPEAFSDMGEDELTEHVRQLIINQLPEQNGQQPDQLSDKNILAGYPQQPQSGTD